ncbi:MAG TPA: hypothetical protein VHX86_18330 [Tepidisphaeraceae bacterium]|jgi:hypothetical protein|nr:hypothetical protein [Tepidisphaeraceae bacterium]
MGKTQMDYARFPRLSVAWQPGLPAETRQADCDGPADELGDASGNRLWNACDANQQESVSARFVNLHADRLRDALLEVQDAAGLSRASADPPPSELLGRLLWKMWIGYRDRALREMFGRGELTSRRAASPSI